MRAQEQEKRPEIEQDQPEVESKREQEGEVREEEPQTKFAENGNVPPVGGEFEEQAGSAQLAFEETHEHQRELKDKVGALVQSRFDGDLKKAFAHYDLNNNGSVDKDEIVNLLADANVGNKHTRGVLANKLVDKGDASRARGGELELEWSEFESAFKAHA